jgi:hypothetical protein
LFLLALLLAGRRLSSAALTITAFTVGHSVTLALATLEVVQVSSRLVEPLIAASIVYVGVENLFRRPRHRAVPALGFGLVHGLGFASVLRELGIAAETGVAGPLLAFNAGVEVGQLSIAAVVVPLVHLARRLGCYERRVLPIASVAIGLLGAMWLVERAW